MEAKVAAQPVIQVQAPVLESAETPVTEEQHAIKMTARDVCVFYGEKQALFDVSLNIRDRSVTALIGPSGCGKSTFLRCLNRMNDTIEGCRVTGTIELDGVNIYSSRVDPVQLRARVGMVFQKPNPFPKSIYENVAYGPRIHGLASSKTDLDEIVINSLKKAGLYEEVKDRLNEFGHRTFRRPAAAALHRPRHLRQSGGHSHGRALFGARPDRYRAHRIADGRAQAELLHRHRDPFDATGGARVATHRIFPYGLSRRGG